MKRSVVRITVVLGLGLGLAWALLWSRGGALHVAQALEADPYTVSALQLDAPVAQAVPYVLNVRVAASSDDAEERSAGWTNVTGDELELVDDAGNLQTVGIRFNGLTITPGLQILNAYVQFEADATGSTATSLTIEGQADDDAPTFVAGWNVITSRPRTSASVAWAPPAWTAVGAAGPDQRTPDLSAVLQEIVDRPGWASGNAIVLIFTGSGRRVAESYDGDPPSAPLLHVEFASVQPACLARINADPTEYATVQAAVDAAVDGDLVKVAGTCSGVQAHPAPPDYIAPPASGVISQVVSISKTITVQGGYTTTNWTVSDPIANPTTLDAMGQGRVLCVTGAVSPTVSGLRLTGGDATGLGGSWSADAGGGVYSLSALTLNGSQVYNNTAFWGGGVYYYGHLYYPGAAMALENSTVRDNVAHWMGAGIYANGGMVLNQTTVDDNATTGQGGGINSHSLMVLNNSTVSGNQGAQGGGIHNTGPMTLNNSTVSGNTSDTGGGINTESTLELNNSTVSGNTANWGGGIKSDYAYLVTSLRNTILAGNVAFGGDPDCSGSINSAEYSLIGDVGSCYISTSVGNLLGVSPDLGPLVGVPGGTEYHPLMSSSPAVDAGDPAGCVGSTGPLAADQRGVARVGRCDVGAYEYTVPGPAASLSVYAGTPQVTPPSVAYPAPLQALVLDAAGTPVDGAAVAFSAPASGPTGTFADTGTETTTATTAETGIATAATLTANALEGSYDVTATATGVPAPIAFSLSQWAWYVIPTGDDGNTCRSPAAPCATIAGVLGKGGFLPGDPVLVASGTYTGTGAQVLLLNVDARLSGGWDPTFSTQDGTSVLDGEGARQVIYVNGGVTASLERFVIRNSSLVFQGGGIHNDGGTLTLSHSVVRDNLGSEGGGIYNRDGGTVILDNCTVSRNRGDWGGGIHNDGTIVLNSSTVSGNTADEGGGIRDDHDVTLRSSILAGNVAMGFGPDCSGGIYSVGYSLVGDTDQCTVHGGTGDLLDVNADLGPLIEGPGGQAYHPLLSGSPAIDAGDPTGCTGSTGPLATDQRGAARVGRCDVGAYEYTVAGPAASLSTQAGTPQRTPPSTAYLVPLQALVTDAIGTPVAGVTVTFDAPASGPSGTFGDTGTETTSALTDEAGIATAATLTANAQGGSYDVTASVTGIPTQALFALDNLGWYVAPGGNDANTCQSPAAPCATIEGALAKGGFLPGDTVLVAGGTYTGTGAQVVQLNVDVRLSGGWDSTFVARSGVSILDGERARRGVYVGDGVTALIEGFTIENGSFPSYFGGGIWNDGGILTLNHSTVRGNASAGGGGIHSGDGILTLNHCTVRDNSASNTGGGIRHYGGVLTLNHSTVRDNLASGDGGGIYVNARVPVTLINSTVSGNRATSGGGGISGNATVLNSTISENTAFYGAGIDGGGVTLRGSILAGNRSPARSECSGYVTSLGYNLVGDVAACSYTSHATDLIGVDPHLGTLIGSPAYYPLLAGSPAIDVVPHSECGVPTDQRGAPRFADAACDVGAYEYTVPGPAASVSAVGGTPQRTPPSVAFGEPLQALVLDAIGSPVPGATVIYDAPASGPSGTFGDTGTETTTAAANESGIVTAATLTANAQGGSYGVTASVAGVPAPASYALSNLGWYVNPTGDDTNDCGSPATPCATIDGALAKAGFLAGDTVLVAGGTYTGTGTQIALLDVGARLLGGWDGTFSAQNGTSILDGEGARRGITVNSDVAALVERLVIENGASTGYSGGVHNDRGTLMLAHTTIRDCASGGLSNYEGTLTLADSTVSGNAGVGIANNGGVLRLDRTTVRGNAGGWSGGGIYTYRGIVDLDQATIRDNTANQGGGLYVDGGGMATLANSTVGGNTAAGRGGGIHNEWGNVSLLHCTVSDNTASSGGGIYGESTQTLKGSILAGNTALDGPDCIGNVGTSGYNLVGNVSDCGYTPDATDLTGVDPHLGALIGSPGYYPLLTGSPAIDHVAHGVCDVAVDQRGVSRFADAACDIGAYEYAVPGPAASVSAHAGTPQHAPPFAAFRTLLQALVLDAAGSPVAGATVTFIAPASGPSGTFGDTGIETTTAVTNESGVATAATLTANALEGSYTVTASVSGIPTPALYNLGNLAWYVAPSGNDTNDCLSPATPCATMDGALAKSGFVPGDTVLVADGTYTGTAAQVALLDESAYLSGGWDPTFSTQSGASILDGEGARRGIHVPAGVTAVVERLEVWNGWSADWGGGVHNSGALTLNGVVVRDSVASYGGGIYSAGGLIVDNSTFTGNQATQGSGGIQVEAGTATITDSTIRGNTSDLGGGIGVGSGAADLVSCEIDGNQALNGGGGMHVSYAGTVTLSDTTVRNNVAVQGGGIHSDGVVTLNDSTVGENRADYGGGIYGDGTVTLNGSTVRANHAIEGGGLYRGSSGTTIALDNSTVSGNSATRGGGLYGAGGPATLNSSTVSGNWASERGGGIYVDPWASPITLQNTLLAGNVGLGEGPDCYGPVDSSGYSLIGTSAGCTYGAGTGDLLDVDAGLGALIGPPGDPLYHPLLPGSPAIDAGDPAGCAGSTGPLATDQRGAARVGRCDIGAYEYTVPGPAASVLAFAGTPQRTPPATDFSVPLEALVLDGIGSPAAGATVTFDAPASGPSGTFSDTGTETTSAVTGQTGIATAATLTANALEGSYDVTASVTGVPTPALYSLGNLAWYVAPGGNDTNDCLSTATPCASVDGVLAKGGFVPGDTVLVAGGTYTGAGAEVVHLDRSARLSGGWDSGFTAQTGTTILDGELSRQCLRVDSGVTAYVEGITCQEAWSDLDPIGGVYNEGTLTLTHSAVISYTGIVGAIGNQGTLILDTTTVQGNSSTGLVNAGPATLVDSAVTGNSGEGIRNTSFLDLANSAVSDNEGEGVVNNCALPPACRATVSDSTISGNAGGISNSGVLAVSNTTISGNVDTFGGGPSGINNRGVMTVSHTTISGNTSDAGGIDNGGTLTLSDSTVSGNTATWAGGGGIFNDGILVLTNGAVISNTAGFGGGILNQTGSVTLTHSTVSGNTSSSNGGGVINSQGVVTLIDSTVSGNVATGYNESAGVLNNGGTVTLQGSTVSGNECSDGGVLSDGTLTLTNSTVSGNNLVWNVGAGIRAWGGGTVTLDSSTVIGNGGYAGISNASSTVTVHNSIVAGHRGGFDCEGSPITSLGHNLDGDGSCGLAAPGDIGAADPVLSPLQDNGGPTETHLPLPGSPAVDAGDDAACPATGQRGVARPQDGDADGVPHCDIGAVERLAAVQETLPIAPGDAPPVYFPATGVTVDCSSGPGGTVTVVRHQENYHRPPSGVGTMDRFWEVSASFSPYVCDLTFHYDEADLDGAAEGEIAGAARRAEGYRTWGYLGGALDTGADTITIPDVSDFSAWLILTSTPPKAVTNLDGTRAGSDLVLDWPAVTEDILGSPLTPDHYLVYRRADEPYFVPTPSDVIATPATPGFTDLGALGNPAYNYYYVVAAVDGAGVESAGLLRLGAFDFELVPAAAVGERAYNLIALPLEMPTVVDADTLAAYAGPGVYMVLRHDAPTQGIEWRLPGLAGTNFSLGAPDVAFLYLDETAANGLSLIGVVSPIGAMGYSLTRPDPGGSCTYNFISVPLYRDDLLDADALAADIGGVYSVSRYNAATQDLTWRIPGVSGENFLLRPGYPYIVCLDETAPSTWP